MHLIGPMNSTVMPEGRNREDRIDSMQELTEIANTEKSMVCLKRIELTEDELAQGRQEVERKMIGVPPNQTKTNYPRRHRGVHGKGLEMLSTPAQVPEMPRGKCTKNERDLPKCPRTNGN